MSNDIQIRLSKVCVLIVDDDPVVRMLIRDALKALGFENTLVASDGHTAFGLLNKHMVDIVFTHWVMEPMDGIEMTRRIRSVLPDHKRTVPVIMLSGKSDKEDVEIARDAGVTEYLIKPFSVQQVCKRVQAVVEAPREFVVCKTYVGPDRRRRKKDGVEERRKKNLKKI